MGIFDLLFPKKCLACAKTGVYLCQDCLDKVRTARPICPVCQKASVDGFTHFKCQKPLGMDGLTSVWRYEGVVRKAILALKYKFALEVVNELSGIFLEVLKSHNSLFLIHHSCVLAPVPLHWYRGNLRGFNQSEQIGKIIAKEMGWKFVPDLLIRKKSTAPQASLEKEARLKNIQGVFVASPNISISQYPNILLFDDVFTTGSTLKEASKVLKRAGVKKVWGLTLAS